MTLKMNLKLIPKMMTKKKAKYAIFTFSSNVNLGAGEKNVSLNTPKYVLHI